MKKLNKKRLIIIFALVVAVAAVVLTIVLSNQSEENKNPIYNKTYDAPEIADEVDDSTIIVISKKDTINTSNMVDSTEYIYEDKGEIYSVIEKSADGEYERKYVYDKSGEYQTLLLTDEYDVVYDDDGNFVTYSDKYKKIEYTYTDGLLTQIKRFETMLDDSLAEIYNVYYTYDNGKLVKIENINSDSSYSNSFEYSKNGSVNTQKFFEDGKVIYEEKCEYDDRGNVIKRTAKSDGKTYTISEGFYNKDKTIYMFKSYYVNKEVKGGKIESEQFGVLTYYSKNGRPVKSVKLDSSYKEIENECIELKYDEKGHLIQMTNTFSGNDQYTFVQMPRVANNFLAFDSFDWTAVQQNMIYK